jgi:Tfp pilus assembly protein PilF
MILKDSRFFQRKVDIKKIFFSVLFVSLFIVITYVAFGTTFAENPENLVQSGFKYIGKGNVDRALEKFNKALSQDSNNFMAYWGLGCVY